LVGALGTVPDVTLLEADDQGPAPTLLKARTLNV